MFNTAHEKLMFNLTGAIHFIGIGGIGMSGIAEILHNFGYKIQGSDQSENDNVLRLKNLGIKVFIRHNSANINDAAIIVVSSAIKANNPEVIAARSLNIPVVKRSEMLAELMRFKLSIAVSGSHGKTTTTALIAALFERANLKPTVINGGIINTHGTNAYLGSGDYLITEADESDGTFIKIPSAIAVITNIDPEHLDYYHNFANLKAAYLKFVEGIPFYGFAVVCKDHPVVLEISNKVNDREVISYGIDYEDLDVKAVNISFNNFGSKFDVEISSKIRPNNQLLKNLTLPIHGKHNILNSLAAIAIGLRLKIDDQIIINAFYDFQGVKRRFSKMGEVNQVTIFDDYAHHPEEIKATLATAKNFIQNRINARVFAVIQPHRYSRLENLFSEFASCIDDADIVLLADIYSAGEDPLPGVNQDVLLSVMKVNYPNKPIIKLDSPEKLASLLITAQISPSDVVICMGAGSITNWAKNLPQELKSAWKHA